MAYLYEACAQISDSCHQKLLRKTRRKMCIYVKCVTGSRNLTGQKTLPTKWGTYMKLVTKYQISAINICWEKSDEKCAYMFNVYKNQLSRQTGSRNLMGPKTLSTIWHTYMTLVTKYQISAIDSCWEKLQRKISWTDGRTDRRKDRWKDGQMDGWNGWMEGWTDGQRYNSINKMNCELMLIYDTPALRQTGSRNLTGQKPLPTIWGTYMKLVIKYQISAINSCLEKCD